MNTKEMIVFANLQEESQEFIAEAVNVASEYEYVMDFINRESTEKDEANCVFADYCMRHLVDKRFKVREVMDDYQDYASFTESKDYEPTMEVLRQLNAALNVLHEVLFGRATLDISLKTLLEG